MRLSHDTVAGITRIDLADGPDGEKRWVQMKGVSIQGLRLVAEQLEASERERTRTEILRARRKGGRQ